MPAFASARLARRPAIIAALVAAAVALVSACSAIKIGYGQADAFAFRWLDGYVDFDDAQSLKVKAALDEWLAWHRRTQLADYADLLARLEADLLADTTPDRVCAWADTVRKRVDVALDHTGPAIADIVPTLSTRQIANIEKAYREKNATYRDDFLQKDPKKRRDAETERQIDRAEMFYGRLDREQQAFLRRSVETSPFDGELVYAERIARQQDAIGVVRKLAAARANREQAMAEIRLFVQRLDRSPRPAYEAYAQRMVDYNCGTISALHNLTNAAQRRHAADKLKGYEVDIRELAAQPG